MKYQDHLGLLPTQTSGKEIEATAEITFNDTNQAISFYDKVRDRLLDVNNWQSLAGKLSAAFQLVDSAGQEVSRSAKKGDYLRINIPGPGNSAGDGYDWALVEEVSEIDKGSLQSTGFRVRPSQNPLNNSDEIAHFYSEESTGNFIVTREKERIFAWIVDRNTSPNQEAGSITDKIRDSAVGLGAVGAFSKVQWQALAEGLVENHK